MEVTIKGLGRRLQYGLWALIAVVSHLATAQASTLLFEPKDIQTWQSKSFAGQTHYSSVVLDGQEVLHARSNGSASALVKAQKIDLLATPYIHFSWRAETLLPPLKEQTKQGDDYVARVYVVFERGIMGLNSLALNYIWSSQPVTNDGWDNAFAGARVKMLALRGPYSQSGQWYSERRNVYQDMITLFGDKGSEEANQAAYRYANAVAIMTDSDNSELAASAYYGPISFRGE